MSDYSSSIIYTSFLNVLFLVGKVVKFPKIRNEIGDEHYNPNFKNALKLKAEPGLTESLALKL